jgi:FkbM family methyltransferase
MLKSIIGRLINGALAPSGRELRRKHDPTLLFRTVGLNTVIDGGANEGGFAEWIRGVSPAAAIHSFEPVPWLYKPLADRFKGDGNFFPYPLALGDTDNEAEFEINTDSYSSSLLPIDDGAAAFFPGLSRSSVIRVPVTTLDTWATGRDLSRPLLLKLDLEGNELAALRGATLLLKQVDYVLAEINFVLLRQGQPSFHEIEKFLAERSFEVMDVYPGHQDRRTGRSIWADVLFGSIHSLSETTPNALREEARNNGRGGKRLVNSLLAMQTEASKLRH